MAGSATKVFGFFCALAVSAVLRHHDEPVSAPASGDAARVVAAPRSPWAIDKPRNVPGVAPGPAAISRDASGAFHVEGAVNGHNIDMIVDTGATVVAIPATDASTLGIFVNPGDFQPIARTASGTANAAPVHIESLAIGSTELRNVEAMVVDGLDRVLLGQTALRQLGRVSINGDHMEIVAN